MAARCLALADAVERLRAPVVEEWSALTGTPVLALEISADDVPPRIEDLTIAARRLAALACPSVVLVHDEAPEALRPLRDACDVAVATRVDLEACIAGITASPLAAAALVQVLRAGGGLAIADALVLESLAYATLQAGPEHARWLGSRTPRAARDADGARATVAMERTGDVLAITLDRPARHNAFCARMRDDLAAALAVAAAERALRVELRGAGVSFCSGGDLDEFGTRPDPATAHAARTTRSPAGLLAAVAERVRVEVQGACIGAGVELAAFAERVVARSDAFFQLPEVGMGLIPGAGGTVSLPRRIGRQRTAFLALSGRRIDVATARAWGLVDRIADEGDLP